MKCLTIRSQFDNRLVDEDINLVHLLSNPCTLPKDQVPQWLFASRKEGCFRRCNESIADVHCLVVEYDKGITIAEWEQQFSHYTYALHTTSSHTPTLNKFRCILPMAMPIPFELLKSRESKMVLKEIFGNIDPSCVVNFQKIPALPANPSDYYSNVNKGRKFNYVDEVTPGISRITIDEEIERQFQHSQHLKYIQREGTNLEAYKAKVDESTSALISSLPRCENGTRYSEFLSVMGKILGAKYPNGDEIYTTAEVQMMLKSVYWDSGLEKAFRNFSRRR